MRSLTMLDDYHICNMVSEEFMSGVVIEPLCCHCGLLLKQAPVNEWH